MQSAFNPRIGCIDFSWESALKVTGKKIDNNRDVFVGPPGIGKSTAMICKSWNDARNISRIKHKGDPDYWEEYFPYWDTFVTINKEKMLAVVNGDWPECTVIDLDEIQKTGNARDSLTDDNRMFNDLWQIKRPMRWDINGSIQEIFAQDKQSRHLWDHYFEILPVNNFEEGGTINFCKPKYGQLKALETGSKQIWYIYNKEHGIISVLGASSLPDKKLMDYCTKLRKEEMKADQDRQLDERKKSLEIKKYKEERQLGAPTKLVSVIQDLLINNPNLSGNSIAKKVGCSEGYARQIKNQLGFGKGASS